MDMDVKKRNSFMEMMNEVAKKNHCRIGFDVTPDDIRVMNVVITKSPIEKTFTIIWPEVPSQTLAATAIWAEFFAIYNGVVREPYHREACFTIKDVIFNDPATIVFWADGTKTVVKCQEGDVFDPEKGLAMAIAKKVYGNKHDYYDPFKKWCGRYYKKRAKIQPWINAINDAVEKLKDCDS